MTPALRLAAGAGAGIVAMSATYPLDMVRGRLTIQASFHEHRVHRFSSCHVSCRRILHLWPIEVITCSLVDQIPNLVCAQPVVNVLATRSSATRYSYRRAAARLPPIAASRTPPSRLSVRCADLHVPVTLQEHTLSLKQDKHMTVPFPSLGKLQSHIVCMSPGTCIFVERSTAGGRAGAVEGLAAQRHRRHPLRRPQLRCL